MALKAGVRIRNSHNTVQIDENWVNFALSAKGTITCVDDGATHPQKMAVGSVTVAGTWPVIAFRAVSKAVNLVRTVNNGNGTWTFHFRCKSNTSFNLDYWVFDQMELGIGFGTMPCGLKIRRPSDGKLVFDAACKPLRIRDIIAPALAPEAIPIRGMGTSGYAVSQVYTPPAGRICAAIQGVFAFVEAQWDQGSYSSEDNPPSETRGDGGEPPLGAKWRYMYLELLHSTAMVYPDGRVSAGLSAFENWQGWYRFSTQQTCRVHGNLMHWVVDVTDY